MQKKITTAGFIILSLLFLYQALFFSSCARTGMPSGGPKDSIPPVVVNSKPLPFQLNYNSPEVIVTFNEYVVPDKLNEKLVVSPPLSKPPTIKTKGKSVIISFNSDLIPDRTYSVDFKDGIKDNNEGNPLDNFRMLFSTYEQLDTLRISGQIVDAYTLIPVQDVYVSAYSILNDSVFTTLRPDFIAKTNKEGFYMFDNLPKGEYRVFAINDGDNNLFFSQETEAIGFIDTILNPTAEFVSKTDTLLQGKDTIISKGYPLFEPKFINLKLFTEDRFSQFITSQKRDEDKIELIFNEGLTDSFNIESINYDPLTALYSEYSKKRDSILIWITDTIMAQKDTLIFRLDYTVLDSLQNPAIKTDTLEFTLNLKKKDTRKNPVKQKPFKFNNNIAKKGFDLNKNIFIHAQNPFDSLKKEFVVLKKFINDSISIPIDFKYHFIDDSKRRIKLFFEKESSTSYLLKIDSAAVHTLGYRIPNDSLSIKFQTQEKDYYGTIKMNLNGFNGNGIIQILKDTEKEEVVSEKFLKPGQKSITFKYLAPEKYLVKLIDDINENNEWDTGHYSFKKQPEPVYYFNKVIRVKSNWDFEENWQINQGEITVKDIFDEEDEED